MLTLCRITGRIHCSQTLGFSDNFNTPTVQAACSLHGNKHTGKFPKLTKIPQPPILAAYGHSDRMSRPHPHATLPWGRSASG